MQVLCTEPEATGTHVTDVIQKAGQEYDSGQAEWMPPSSLCRSCLFGRKNSCTHDSYLHVLVRPNGLVQQEDTIYRGKKGGRLEGGKKVGRREEGKLAGKSTTPIDKVKKHIKG